MAPSGNKWLSKAWSEYTQDDAPWVEVTKTAVAVLVAPLLAVFLSFADLIETWTDALLINPLIGVWEFGQDLVLTVFFGAVGRTGDPLTALFDGIDDPLFGLTSALRWSWSGVLDTVGALGFGAFPTGVVVALAFAYVLGRVINRG